MNDIWDFIDEDIAKDFQKKVDNYTTQRNKPTNDEIKETIDLIKDNFETQYKEQLLKKAINKREFYRDNLNGDVILVKIPKGKPKSYPKQDGSLGYYCFAFCALIESDITIWLNEEKFHLEEDTVYILRGKINEPDYRDVGSKNKDDFCTEAEYLRQKGASNIEDLDPYGYERRFSFNIWNIIIKGR